LTRPFDQHLDSNELDALVSPLPAQGIQSVVLTEEALEEARRHLEGCDDCSRKVQMHRQAQDEILDLGTLGTTQPKGSCPSNVDWLAVAAGTRPEQETKDLMLHAAQCAHCGPELHKAADMLSDDATTQEEVLLQELRTSTSDWRRETSVRLGQTATRGARADAGARLWWRSLPSWQRAAVVAASLAIAVVAAWLTSRTFRASSADELIAQAYSERRTLEIRIPGAKHAPLHVERGKTGSSSAKPESLLEAEILVGENLREHPNDPVWLQGKALTEILDGNYDEAIKTLDFALESHPDSAPLLADLGAAYYARGKAASRVSDYRNSVELLGKALAKNPNDLVALFNQALAYEQLSLYSQAVEVWERYLRIDPQSDWSDEARQRLNALRERLRPPDQSRNGLLQ
jgi:tetratricopeptide (TPR) repeat protein